MRLLPLLIATALPLAGFAQEADLDTVEGTTTQDLVAPDDAVLTPKALTNAAAVLREAAKEITAAAGGRDTGKARAEAAGQFFLLANQMSTFAEQLANADDAAETAAENRLAIRVAIIENLQSLSDTGLNEIISTFELDPNLGATLDPVAGALLSLTEKVADAPDIVIPMETHLCIATPGLSEAIFVRDVRRPLNRLVQSQVDNGSPWSAYFNEAATLSEIRVTHQSADPGEGAEITRLVSEVLADNVRWGNLTGPMLVLPVDLTPGCVFDAARATEEPEETN